LHLEVILQKNHDNSLEPS